MALRAAGPGRPDHTRVKVNRLEGDVQIPSHDLIADGDLVIPDDVGVDNPPFIGGGSRSVLAVASSEGNNFSITFEYGTLDSAGNFQVDYTYGPNQDANLSGDSDYFIRISPVRDRVRVTITDTSGAGSNTIAGGLNSA